MAYFDRMDMQRKQPIPVGIKMILLIAVIVGISIRACWKKSQTDKIIISEVQIVEKSLANIDVSFKVQNRMGVEVKKDFIIKVYNTQNEEIATKITQIKLPPASNRRYRKQISKFIKSISSTQEIAEATVELYYRSIFD
ncbi:MAG: hypothetical protein SVM86_01505 [Candidatus Cloacimonadota bacterium]|nr:hypothetical protein [Candidatus Cloacimonadota bacterium]